MRVCVGILVLPWWNTEVFQDKGQPSCAFSYIWLQGPKDGFISLEQHLISECIAICISGKACNASHNTYMKNLWKTPCLRTMAKTPWLCILLSNAGLLRMLQIVCTFLHAKVFKTFGRLCLSDQTVKTHWLWIFTSTNKQASLPGEELHGVTCAPVLFDFLAATFISRIWRRLRLTRLVATVTNLPCCEADWGRRRHRRIPKVLGSFLSIHEASQVDSSRRNSWVAAQSCWTSQLLASTADKPVLVLVYKLITNSHIPKLCAKLADWTSIDWTFFFFGEKRQSSRLFIYLSKHGEMRSSHCATFLPPSTNHIQDLSSGPWLDCAGIQSSRCRLAWQR